MKEWLFSWLRPLLGLPPGASTSADGIDLLHAFVIGVTMVMSTYVFLSAAWFTIRYRRRREGQLTKRLVASRAHEIFTIGGVTTTFLLWWVLGYRQYVAMSEPPADAQVVYVEAKQWMWKFTYTDGRSTNDVLTVPAGRPVKLVMSSRDVIHSFFVPAFRLKQDVIPGRYVATWFEAKGPGRFPIWCAEYCGVSHSAMRGEVVVLAPDDYAKWRREGAPNESDLVTRGRQVAMKRGCVACHTLDGQKHVGPTWRGLYGSDRLLADGRHVVADDAYLTRSMMEPLADRVAGYPNVMPTYRGQLSSSEAGALVELIKSLRSDSTTAPAPLPPSLPALDVTAADGGAR